MQYITKHLKQTLYMLYNQTLLDVFIEIKYLMKWWKPRASFQNFFKLSQHDIKIYLRNDANKNIRQLFSESQYRFCNKSRFLKRWQHFIKVILMAFNLSLASLNTTKCVGWMNWLMNDWLVHDFFKSFEEIMHQLINAAIFFPQ